LAQSNEFNAQHQQRVTWPAGTVVARSFIDQLTRSRGIKGDRTRAVRDALARADKVRSRRDRGAAALVAELNTLATQLDGDARAAAGQDAVRLRLLSVNLKERASRLK